MSSRKDVKKKKRHNFLMFLYKAARRRNLELLVVPCGMRMERHRRTRVLVGKVLNKFCGGYFVTVDNCYGCFPDGINCPLLRDKVVFVPEIHPDGYLQTVTEDQKVYSIPRI